MQYKVLILRNGTYVYIREENIALENSLFNSQDGLIRIVDAKNKDTVIVNKKDITEIISEKMFEERMPHKKEQWDKPILDALETQKLLAPLKEQPLDQSGEEKEMQARRESMDRGFFKVTGKHLYNLETGKVIKENFQGIGTSLKEAIERGDKKEHPKSQPTQIIYVDPETYAKHHPNYV